jgi:HAD superfamily hydrolase (TIGR01549 family)
MTVRHGVLLGNDSIRAYRLRYCVSEVWGREGYNVKMIESNDIKHIWFDFAGTLYRETPLFNAAHDKLRFSTYAKLVGEQDMDRAEKEYLALYRQYGTNAAVFRTLGKSSSFWQDTFDELDVAKLIQPDPVVAETVERISRQLPISLFSNFKKDQILAILKHLGIPATCFTHILDGDAIAVRKPDLEGYFKMVELSGISASHILYIGDRVEADVKPAKQVGIVTCLIYSESVEADYCVRSFAELEKLVKQML